jgi:esterase/lipase superfamily enzyme
VFATVRLESGLEGADLNPVSNRCAHSAAIVARPIQRRFAVLTLLAAAVALTACATRPENGFLLPVAVSANGATDHILLVATTRAADDRPGTYFNGERSASLSYAEFTVSVPPNHVPGLVQFASTAPGDPNTNFVVRDAELLDGDKAFVAQLNAQLAMRPKGSRTVFVFVHGFNTMFAEGVYTAAQLAHDSRAQGVPVLFTWASRGRPTQYVYDTNSATSARDNLDHMLRLVFASNAEKVNVLAHSMGNWVTVEAFRQIKLEGGIGNRNKIGLIVLASPDIDIDVFKSQLRAFGNIQTPFYVVISRNDKALGLSNFIAGGETRVGNASNTEELTALGATVIDLTDVQSNDSLNHSKFTELATVAPELRSVLANGIQPNSDSGGAGGGTGGDSLVTLLGTPVRIVSGQ